MTADDEFQTIAGEARSEIKVKASRFIGESFLTATVDEALEKLQTVRKREHAATHHCYAYIVGLGNDEAFKYSDDGEPNGTAGKPIYDAIGGRNLTNTLVVVTRYFGGTKLGTGGLVRAYSEAARLVLEASGAKTHYLTTRFDIELDFSHYDQWLKLLNKLDAATVASDFTERVSMQVEIRQSRAEELRTAFVELTSGKGKIEIAG